MITIDLSQSNMASLPPPTTLPLLSEAVPDLKPASRTPVIPQLETRKRLRRTDQITALAGWHVPVNAGALLARALDDQWCVYRKQLRQCQKEFSETSIHQLRVATRRLMTRFELVSRITTNEKADHARRKLRQRLKFLGKLRDLQVQISFVSEHLEAYPEISPVLENMAQRDRELARAVMAKVLRTKTAKLKKWTEACCKELACADSAREREPVGGAAFQSLADAFEAVNMRRQMIDPANSETLHRTRVAFKRFRYIVEALSPAFTGLGKAQLRRFATYQRRMGTLQDLEVLQEYMTEFVSRRPGTAAALKKFSRYLATRRARALRSCLNHVDDLFGLYQPIELHYAVAVTRNAA